MTIPAMIGKISGFVKGYDWKQITALYSRVKFSVTIVPSGVSFLKPATFRSWVVTTFLLSLIVLTVLVTAMLMVYTPLNSLFFSKTVQLSHHQVNDLRMLQEKVMYLDHEIENLKKQNQQLRNAINMGDTTVLNKFQNRTKIGGNIFFGFELLLEKIGVNLWSHSISFRAPCEGYKTNKFDAYNGHYGLDFATKTGTPVYAAANGYIIFSDFTTDDGNMVIIGHSDGFITVYKHCKSLLKGSRQSVYEGEQIALSGNTGRLSYGPHLHFEIWQDGVPMDPQKFIPITKGN